MPIQKQSREHALDIFERICMTCRERIGCKLYRGTACIRVKDCSDCTRKDTDDCHVTYTNIVGGGTAKTHSICDSCADSAA